MPTTRESSRAPDPTALIAKQNAPDVIQQDRDDIQCRVERKYMTRASTGALSAHRYDTLTFWAQTIKQYNKPLNASVDVPYR